MSRKVTPLRKNSRAVSRKSKNSGKAPVLTRQKPVKGPRGEDEFIDKCTERYFFESTGVKLYDAAIRKAPQQFRAKLTEIRDQERAHAQMLREVIRTLDADPRVMTDSAKLSQIESSGIIHVVEHGNFEEVMDALLVLELVDHAKWELLIEIADELGDDEAKESFEEALGDETDHLVYIREQIVQTTMYRLQTRAA